MKIIEATSNLKSGITEAQYPLSSKGNTFSIKDGFKFTLKFEAENQTDHGNYCLIQVIVNSERILESKAYHQKSYFKTLPVLDGDAMQGNQLWYTHETFKTVNNTGEQELELEDNPSVGTSSDFYGSPTQLNVNEKFVIIFAKETQGKYEELGKWEWEYSDNSTKTNKGWNISNFKVNFQKSLKEIDLSTLKGDVRANSKSNTVVTKK